MRKILFASSEVHPLIKTGGLADVSGSLPKALKDIGQDVRIVLPGYPAAMKAAGELQPAGRVQTSAGIVNILQGTLPDSQVPIWFLVHPESFGREGNPYLAADGTAWPDNAQRFTLFCKATVEIAMNRAKLDWQPDIVHCNDWQTGLVPALLSLEYQRPATIFTIHNLAYQGIFPAALHSELELPQSLWNHHGLEFHHQLSFIKGGLIYADQISTVSPSYAREIQQPDFGAGLDGLLRHRSQHLQGILNGIDEEQWNPARDRHLPQNFSADDLTGKAANKLLLQREFSLPEEPDVMLIGLIGRLVQQKGIDLVIEALPALFDLPVQCIILGSGNMEYEQTLENQSRRHPDRLAVRIGYDESLSHRIEAGLDLFLMPSRFEPCGLNQMYSQRYGTLPLVRRVGGLADTVVDAMPETIQAGTATGFCFDESSPGTLIETVKRALLVYASRIHWHKMQRTGMVSDFSWTHSARQYTGMYEKILKEKR